MHNLRMDRRPRCVGQGTPTSQFSLDRCSSHDRWVFELRWSFANVRFTAGRIKALSLQLCQYESTCLVKHINARFLQKNVE